MNKSFASGEKRYFYHLNNFIDPSSYNLYLLSTCPTGNLARECHLCRVLCNKPVMAWITSVRWKKVDRKSKITINT